MSERIHFIRASIYLNFVSSNYDLLSNLILKAFLLFSHSTDSKKSNRNESLSWSQESHRLCRQSNNLTLSSRG